MFYPREAELRSPCVPKQSSGNEKACHDHSRRAVFEPSRCGFHNAWTIVRETALTRTIAIIVLCLITWFSLFGFSLYAFSELKTPTICPSMKDSWSFSLT